MTKAGAGSPASAPGSDHIAFLRHLGEFLENDRDADVFPGLLVVHLSNLFRVNTALGYRAGFRLHSEFEKQLRKLLREGDWLMNLSGDRFAIALDRIKNKGHLILAANRVVQIANNFSSQNSAKLLAEVRVGAAMYPQHGDSAELLLRNGELAVEYAASRKTSFALYEEDPSAKLTSAWSLEGEIAMGLENCEFQVFYQPKIDARSLEPCGAEALMRWPNPRIGQVFPDQFIEVAEKTDQIDELTNFVLHSCARDIGAWPADPAELSIAVNLTPNVIENGNIMAQFKHVAAIWGIEVSRFTAEVTENGLMSTDRSVLGVLHELREAGIRVSIDDFGTGNSSLAYFKDIPADELKIDKSFVFAMLENEPTYRLVRTIINLAHSFNLKVVAEGVENAECAEALQKLGCDVFQGYHFSRPVPHDEFLEFLRNYKS